MAEYSLTDLIDLPLKDHMDQSGYYSKDSSMNSSHKMNKTIEPPEDVAQQVHSLSGFKGFHKQLIPTEPLKEGEQYRFHFNAQKCIGCQCCVVACSEQNNNPHHVNWRRVGEIEAGKFPYTRKFYLSMGCNHCIEPSCMKGCPTSAYEKDPVTGIVRHKADSCIGCGYCQWNCPYGVPQFNHERKIVTKCDMCYGRLEENNAPACAEVCPENAITIEKVDISEWIENHDKADAPGMPESDQTLSTTKITLPKGMPSKGTAVNEFRLNPEHAHTTLIIFLTLSQLAVGGFIALWFFDIFHRFTDSHSLLKQFGGLFSGAMLFISALALNTAVFHLGRPIYAFKAVKMWKTSWLSREVLFFGIFGFLAFLYAGLWLDELYLNILFFPDSIRTLLGTLVAISGLAGIFSSAYIYMVPARPAWNTPNTALRFFMTTFVLGPSFAIMVMLASQKLQSEQLLSYPYLYLNLGLMIFAALIQLFILSSTFFYMNQTKDRELKGTAILLTTRFRYHLITRMVLLVLGGFIFPVILIYTITHGGDYNTLFWLSLVNFAVLSASEVIGRYLFFVSVIPKNMAGTYFTK